MAEQQITPGTKLQVAFDVPMGQKTDFNMLATYKEDLDEAYFLMSAPVLADKPLLMDEKPKAVAAVSGWRCGQMPRGHLAGRRRPGVRGQDHRRRGGVRF